MRAMSKLLLNLRHVPDDEADDVRAFLREAGIAFYETPPSPFGISAGGIWIEDRDRHPQAKALMADYQQRRRERARAEHAQAQRDGTAETFLGLLRRRPLFVLATLAAIVFVASLVLLPFVLLRL